MPRTTTATRSPPSPPGMLNTPVSSEGGSAPSHASSSSSLPPRRSGSLDVKRGHPYAEGSRVRTGSTARHGRNVSGAGSITSMGSVGSAGSIARIDHPYARSPLMSPAEADDDDDINNGLRLDLNDSGADSNMTTNAKTIAESPAVRTPVDRLPSPPLTPVGSRENMRRPSGKAAARPRGQSIGEGSSDIIINIDNRDKGESEHAHGTGHGSKPGNGTDNEGRLGVGAGTNHGELSTWFESTANSAPGSVVEAESEEDIAFAQPLNPLAGLSLASLNKDLPRRPTSDVPPVPSQVPPLSSPSEIRVGGAMSPQPWELVDPPPGNNGVNTVDDGMQMQEIRVRNQSLKSNASVSQNVVVKNGKRFRIPRSSYYFGPPPDTSAFGTDPIGHIGVHHPREIIRIERDYSGGELVQFSPAYPLELEGRINPTQFLETVNTINESLIEAHSLRWSFFDNTLAFFTLYISRILFSTYYDRRMRRLQRYLDDCNRQLYNPNGLNILWPKNVAFMFLEIEYY